jgi:hypothetical protein
LPANWKTTYVHAAVTSLPFPQYRANVSACLAETIRSMEVKPAVGIGGHSIPSQFPPSSSKKSLEHVHFGYLYYAPEHCYI